MIEFENYLKLEIKRIEDKLNSFKDKDLEHVVNNTNSTTLKKLNTSLYLFKYLLEIYKNISFEDFKSTLESMNKMLDMEIDSYLDIEEDIIDDMYYLCSIYKKSILEGIIKQAEKIEI